MKELKNSDIFKTKLNEKKKPSIQKAIFKSLSGKKAISYELLKAEVKNYINNINSTTSEPEYAISRSIKNLTSDGLVECFQSDLQPYFRLTDAGKKKLNNSALDNDTGLVTNKWDGFWRIVILDLPEDRKSEREALRYLLKKAGFNCVKNSVWVSMYPYENLFINIKNDLNLTFEMIIIVTDKIDDVTKKEFLNLSKNK